MTAFAFPPARSRPELTLLLVLWLLLLALLPVRAARAVEPSPPPPAATPARQPLADYAAALRAAAAAIDAAGRTPAAVTQATADLAAYRAIRLPTGETLPIKPLLRAGMAPEQAVVWLRATADEIDRSAADDVAARQALLVAGLEAAPVEGQQSLLDWLLRWLDRLLTETLRKSSGGLQETPTEAAAWNAIGTVVLVVGGLALLLLLGYWLRGLLQRFVGGGAASLSADAEGLPATEAAARQMAAQQAQVGSYRAAVRSLYLAALRALQARGLLAANRALTNRELLARTSLQPELRGRLAPVVSAYEAIWYGVREPGLDAFAIYQAQVDALIAALPAPPDDAPPEAPTAPPAPPAAAAEVRP